MIHKVLLMKIKLQYIQVNVYHKKDEYIQPQWLLKYTIQHHLAIFS